MLRCCQSRKKSFELLWRRLKDSRRTNLLWLINYLKTYQVNRSKYANKMSYPRDFIS